MKFNLAQEIALMEQAEQINNLRNQGLTKGQAIKQLVLNLAKDSQND